MKAVDAIQAIMKQQNKTQGKMSKETGLSQQTLSRALKEGMSLSTLISVADSLGYDVILKRRVTEDNDTIVID